MSKGKFNTSESTILRSFTNAVTSSNVGLAGILTDGTTSSSLEPTLEVINQLKKKHPPAEPANPEILIKGTHTKVRPGEFRCRANRRIQTKSGSEV